MDNLRSLSGHPGNLSLLSRLVAKSKQSPTPAILRHPSKVPVHSVPTPSTPMQTEHGPPRDVGTLPIPGARSGRRKDNAGGGTRTLTSFHSTDFRTVYGFRRPAIALESACASLRSGLSLHRTQDLISGVRCCPSSLYTFPERCSGLGSGLPFHRFPRIWAVLHRRFPGEHSSFLSSPLRLPFRHARMALPTFEAS